MTACMLHKSQKASSSLSRLTEERNMITLWHQHRTKRLVDNLHQETSCTENTGNWGDNTIDKKSKRRYNAGCKNDFEPALFCTLSTAGDWMVFKTIIKTLQFVQISDLKLSTDCSDWVPERIRRQSRGKWAAFSWDFGSCSRVAIWADLFVSGHIRIRSRKRHVHTKLRKIDV